MFKNDYCKNLINCLSFHQENIRFCTTLQLGKIISQYEEKDVQELIFKIMNYRSKVQQEFPNECKGCIHKNTEPANTEKITRIDLFYWYHCNCGCFYCSYRDKTGGKYSDKPEEGNPFVYKTIKELYKEGKIDTNRNLNVIFGGGEIGVLKEAPKLIELFLKNKVGNIWCETSGIKYLTAIENMLKQGKGGITVAVCCGDREIYKKIKQRDKYNQVMKNLEKYGRAAGKYKMDSHNRNKVVSKFIILQGFNNTKDAVDKWLIETKRIGLTTVEISMEFCWGIHTKKGQKIEEYNYELFEYAAKKCNELGLILKKNQTSVDLMSKGIY